MMCPEDFSRNGYATVPGVLTSAQAAHLITAVPLTDESATHQRRGKAYAHRSALTNPVVVDLVLSAPVITLAERALGDRACAVRAILFDKVPGANWKIPWHQDLTIVVKERAEVEGYGPWSIKEGEICVQPPREILESMVALRLHLDPCGEENGPLRVLPGTHAHGRLSGNRVDDFVARVQPRSLTCNLGDAILMRPLLLHASSPAVSPSHRRVLHIEYASRELARPLEWARVLRPVAT